MDIRHGEQHLEDFSALLELVPREMNVLEKMDMFDVDYLTGTLASFERITAGTDDMYSVARDADRQVAGDENATTAHIETPFFTLDKSVKPNELQNIRAFATADDPETYQNKVERIVQRIQRSHSRLLKKVMYAALKGSTYAVDKAGNPRPNLNRTFQSMFAIDNADMFNGAAGGAKTYDLSDQTLNPLDEFETFRSHVIAKAQDGVAGGDEYELVMMMGSTAFNALKNHTDVVEGYANFTDGASLRQRLGGLKNNRMFEFDGIIFMEDKSGEIPLKEAYIFPRELARGELKYSPANTLEGASGTQTAEEAYIFIETTLRKAEIQSETSVVGCIPRVDMIGHYTFSGI